MLLLLLLPTYGMGQIGGHNVGLEDIDIHADAHSLSAANGAHGGDGRLAVVKGFAPVKIKICTLFSVSAFRFSFFGSLPGLERIVLSCHFCSVTYVSNCVVSLSTV